MGQNCTADPVRKTYSRRRAESVGAKLSPRSAIELFQFAAHTGREGSQLMAFPVRGFANKEIGAGRAFVKIDGELILPRIMRQLKAAIRYPLYTNSLRPESPYNI